MTSLALRMLSLSFSLTGLSAASMANAADNSVVIQQIGDYNISEVSKNGESESNTLDLLQAGGANSSLISLTGNFNSGSTEQEGNDHLADILITGNQNQFSISQTGIGAIVEHRNSVLLRQEGNNNIASHTQIGLGNSQDLAQLGNDNSAALLQDGNDNSLILQQQGDFNAATLTQYGDTAAPIEVYQTGGMTIEITHTAGGS